MRKNPWGDVDLVGLGRLGLRTALNLMQVHRGGPARITAFDGQTISHDDLIFRIHGGAVGEYKTGLLEKLAGTGFGRIIRSIPENVTAANLDLIRGDVVCIEIAGGDTLPVTSAIIRHAQEIGASTISTMGVFGLYDMPVLAMDIRDADPENPIVRYLLDQGVENHRLVGTGKLIRDWEPVIPPVLDLVSAAITSEIVKLLEERKP